MKSQLHRLPQRVAIHYALMQVDTFTCMKLSLHNYAGWTFTPQTVSSHCLLKHRPYSTSNALQSFQSSAGHAPPHPQGSHLHLKRSLACFQLERERLSSTAALKKWQLELNKIEGAWKANWLMSHMQGSWRPGTAADNLLPSMSNRKALQGIRT